MSSTAMRETTIADLAAALARFEPRLVGPSYVRVSGVCQDSRRVRRGDLFVARAGARADGARYVEQALALGAHALLVERDHAPSTDAVPVLSVNDVRAALPFAADLVHGSPSRALRLVGITGTNGKTTSAWLVQHALSGAGLASARLGTLGYSFGNETLDYGFTTPEADELTGLLARARDQGAQAAVMEVSSHALVQARVEALRFEVAAFTNLTQDHLDFHGSMAAYGEAKLRLFTDLGARVSVVNVDDAFGRTVAARARGRVLRVGRTTVADVTPRAVVSDARGIRGTIQLPSGDVQVDSRLVGAHNLDNLLLALAIAEGLGLDVQRAADALGRAPAVPGRLERCDVPVDDVTVLVDYAHTPDALTRALSAVRSLGAGRVLSVFGCGGDRDRAKRPLMGEAAGRGSDLVFVTSDNPRSERPEDIRDQILPGLAPYADRVTVELDRARAIELAVERAQAGDVVLIAGKGHEPYQIIGTDVRRFDDRVEARRALALRRTRLGR